MLIRKPLKLTQPKGHMCILPPLRCLLPRSIPEDGQRPVWSVGNIPLADCRSGKFVEYAKTSGGIFLDCSIHDIDLMLRFIGENCKLISVQAVGVTTVYHRLDSTKDHDSEIDTIEFQGGRVATLYCSRMMTAGQEDTTEIICERRSLKVNMQGRKNHVEVYDLDSARCELPQHYYERFREAFATEASEFTDCCLDKKPTPVPL